VAERLAASYSSTELVLFVRQLNKSKIKLVPSSSWSVSIGIMGGAALRNDLIYHVPRSLYINMSHFIYFSIQQYLCVCIYILWYIDSLLSSDSVNGGRC
jgi:hypothetical protein